MFWSEIDYKYKRQNQISILNSIEEKHKTQSAEKWEISRTWTCPLEKPTAAKENWELKETDVTFQFEGKKQSGAVDDSTKGAVNETEYNPKGVKESLQYM